MTKDVRWERVFPADPDTVFDAITRRSAGWLWPITYEPREGGTEKGLTARGGRVTAWQPGHLFRTRADDDDGWYNQLEYHLEAVPGGTKASYLHVGSYADDPVEYEQCAEHTAFYRELLAEYLRSFAGRDARRTEAELPGSFAEIRDRLDTPAADVFYRASRFLGLRTENSLVAVFGRDHWGGSVGVSLHLFHPDADPAAETARWKGWAA
ncbi:SRPBCC domain-containing protein [Cryptosporangium sp. NPDC051539]|uniref:SRPBCC domain-containing protein n=1 Tax=Cryptosporangium sp. NPDC051539 TaxID=3363962 RepID=UPI0037A05E56